MLYKIFSVVQRLLVRFDYELTLTNIHHTNPIRFWNRDTRFLSFYEVVKDHTIVDKVRLFMLYQLASKRQTHIAEVGAYRGGSGVLMALSSPQSTIHIFDTFEGMPETDPSKDVHKKGEFIVDTAAVLAFLNRANIKVYKGFFPDTATPIENTRFGLVHLDVDIYKSLIDCLEFFYPRMEKGGVIIADDYGFVSCPGATRAWDDFFTDKQESPIYLPTGQCLVIKT